jgi:hypothetical protein
MARQELGLSVMVNETWRLECYLGAGTMVNDEWEVGPKASRFSLRAFLIRDWPYLAMLALALFGVAYTSIAPIGFLAPRGIAPEQHVSL